MHLGSEGGGGGGGGSLPGACPGPQEGQYMELKEIFGPGWTFAPDYLTCYSWGEQKTTKIWEDHPPHLKGHAHHQIEDPWPSQHAPSLSGCWK